MSANDTTAAQLLQIIERVERLEQEKAAIADDIKAVFSEAKARGFIPKIMKKMIKERAMSATDLAEERALEQVYRAALGILGDTSLGAAAIQRLSKKPKKPPSGDAKPDDGQAPAPDDAPTPDAPAAPEEAAPPPAEPTEAEIEAAREDGRAAGREGKPVLANPHPAGTKLRAAWDEGWCQAQGSDGMEIAEAYRRPKKPPTKGDGTTPAPAAAEPAQPLTPPAAAAGDPADSGGPQP